MSDEAYAVMPSPADLIPHHGAMCLLDRILRFDRDGIVCETLRHRDPGNPLREGDRLAALHAIEFAAQAMAAHGRLRADAATAPAAGGLLLAVRDCRFAVDRLDTLDGPLVVRADCIAAGSEGLTYRFAVAVDDTTLVAGRASVLLALPA